MPPQATVTALEEHGFSVEIVDDLDAAREEVLARIAEGSSVMTNTSVILQGTWIRRRSTTARGYDPPALLVALAASG
jgi:hypothetical protein